MKRFLISIVTLLAFTTVWGQSKVSPFTAHYIRGQQAVTRAAVSDEIVSAYLHTEGVVDVSALEALGVKVNLQLDGILTARLPLSAIEGISQLPFIKYIQMGTPVRPMMDKARAVSGVDRLHAAEGLDMAYTGKDVVVGIIDGGFDYTHPAFYDAEGKLRIKRVWDQYEEDSIVGGHKTPPIFAKYGYGREFVFDGTCEPWKGDIGDNSHGTHVLGIAAGSNSAIETDYYGIAPDADIVLMSHRKARGDKGMLLYPDNVNISEAMAYIYDYADSVGKPCVINLSYGNYIGPHDGTSAFDMVADQLQGPGRILVGSIGNYGNNEVHVSKSFMGTEDTPLMAMIDYKENMDSLGGEIDIWADKGMELDLKLAIVSKRDGSEIYLMETLDMSSPNGTTKEYTFPSNYASGKVLVTTEVNPLNGKPHALVTSDLTSMNLSRYRIGILLIPRSAGTVHAWADAVYTMFKTEVPEGWTPGNKEHTLCEIGGTGKNIISVGAFVSSDSYKELGSSQTKYTDEKLGALATFSSVGPTVDGRMKPDVIAPGTFIVSAISSLDNYSSSYPTASAVVWNEKTYNYSYMQGTSMAAPFVSGVIATWLQAYPQLDSEQIRTVLQKTATNDEYTNSSTCGYGKIDAYEGLKEVLSLAANIEGVQEDSFADVITRRTSQGLMLCFTRPVGQTIVQLYDTSGVLMQKHSLVVTEAGQTFMLAHDNLSRGIYLLRVGHQVVKVAL